MEIRQIECFLACEEHRSFTAAARALNLVQSAVSTSVAKLEHELGARLFDRTPGGLELTEAGQAALGPARDMLRARHDIVDGIELSRGRIRGEVVVGNLLHAHTVDLAAAIAELRRRYPEVTLRMRQSMTGMAGNIAGLRDGSLEIALLAGMTTELAGLTQHAISAESLVLCTAPEHPLAGRAFTAADLAGMRFIDYAPGWGIRAIADELFPDRNPVIEVADQVFALELAAKDFGVTLAQRSVAERAAGIAFAERADVPIPWLVTVGHDARRTPSNAARTVIAILRAYGARVSR
ncbi:LysR family transcriptional regulator [Nocardia yamanashiensis]|uniref:LysR family transcriptional regulator n=1 Tax=Nocardia yamanashiensis TaxID=209247 RepID=UPI001E64CA4A|nr:LysR family transcriptional regulator [Nocardia yamanashiensis]UGT41872.1 LysR family transcriptional regulator [Nocardia yamanashiensis]